MYLGFSKQDVLDDGERLLDPNFIGRLQVNQIGSLQLAGVAISLGHKYEHNMSILVWPKSNATRPQVMNTSLQSERNCGSQVVCAIWIRLQFWVTSCKYVTS